MSGVVFSNHKWLAVVIVGLISWLALANPEHAAAAACTAPATDYGTVSGLSASVNTAGTYRIWTRMAAPDSTNNTYLLEVDGSTCYTVGGSSVPVYASGSSTHFVNDTTNWIDQTSTGTTISLSLSSGAHTFKLIGNAPDVVVDRLIITSDTTCTPTGVGDNCVDTTAPTFSSLAAGSITQSGVTITWTTNEASTSQVQYSTDTSYNQSSTPDSSLVTSHSVTLSGLASGTLYYYRVSSTDGSGNIGTSSGSQTFTTASTTTYRSEDINQDGVVNILDVSLMISKWNQTTNLGRADINGDGVVNILDLSLLISQYGH